MNLFQKYLVLLPLLILWLSWRATGAAPGTKPEAEFTQTGAIPPGLSTPSSLSTEPEPTPYEQTIFRQQADFKAYQCSKPDTSGTPVIRLLGLDAVGWPVLNELLRTERLPGFKRVICTGAAAVFKTDVGNTAVSCTTITTGKERFKHGILNDDEAGVSPFSYSWRAVKVARLWQMLQYHHRSILSCGFILADDTNKRLDTIDELRRLHNLPGYDCILTFYDKTDSVQHQYLTSFLVARSEWGQTLALDSFWENHARSAIASVTSTFAEVDSLIEDLLLEYPQDSLIIFSDHGQSPKSPSIKFIIQLNEVLRNHKITELNDNSWLIDETIIAVISYIEKKSTYATDLKTSKIISGDLQIPILHLKPLHGKSQRSGETLASKLLHLFHLDSVFDNNQYALNNLVQELVEYRVADHRLFERENKVTLVLSQDMIDFIGIEGGKPYALRQVFFGGKHDRHDDGILIAHGPAFRSGIVTEPLSLTDFTPTILYLAGLPIGRDMDGKVAAELFHSEYLLDHEITFIDSYDSVVQLTPAPGERREISTEELDLYRQRGYPGLP